MLVIIKGSGRVARCAAAKRGISFVVVEKTYGYTVGRVPEVEGANVATWYVTSSRPPFSFPPFPLGTCLYYRSEEPA